MDIIKELRLRRWARENYVATESRSNRWNAVILNEMESMDSDIAEQKQNLELMTAYAPVLPNLGADQIRKLHQPHNQIAEPNFLSESSPEQSELFFG